MTQQVSTGTWPVQFPCNKTRLRSQVPGASKLPSAPGGWGSAVLREMKSLGGKRWQDLPSPVWTGQRQVKQINAALLDWPRWQRHSRVKLSKGSTVGSLGRLDVCDLWHEALRVGGVVFQAAPGCMCPDSDLKGKRGTVKRLDLKPRYTSSKNEERTGVM